jgi:hypothetical protein
MVDSLALDEEVESTGGPGPSAEVAPDAPMSTIDHSRRRFTIAVVVGMAIVGVPLLWMFWDLWTGSVNVFRELDPSNFYDLQARAMFAGHLYVPQGDLGIEAFDHAGHQYTYFGILPSLLRMPILAFTHQYDSRLTAPSMLLAWIVTGIFSSVLLWRTRLMMRGNALMGRAEAASFGVLVATIMGGSVLMSLAASPWVYNEDFAWSAAATTGSLFCLLGVVERPSWGRVTASGLLILAANLDRTPTGYACTIGAFLVAGWFAWGKGGTANRRWVVPVVIAGLVPFAVNCVVTYAKFGVPIGLPMAEQVWANVNLHRRQFLAANGGKAFSFAFLPSTLWAYLQPGGLHFSSVVPYVSLPTAPAKALAGAVLDQTYPTASIPASMPLLFLLSIWGTITAFRPRPIGRMSGIRILLLTGAACSTGVLLWGYIAERYLTDLLPFLIVASGVGMIDLWRRLDERTFRTRGVALSVLALFGVFCLWANIGIAVTPTPQWTSAQTDSFVTRQNSISHGALASTVVRGSSLPDWAPEGTLFAVGNCSGLYRSTGIDYSTVPGQQIQHLTWVPVEQSVGFNHTMQVTLNLGPGGLTQPVPLMTYGKSTLVLKPDGPDKFRLQFEKPGAASIPWPSAVGWAIPLARKTYQFEVMTDPNLHSVEVIWADYFVIGHYLAGDGPAVVLNTKVAPGAPTPGVVVREVPPPPDPMPLCHSLIGRS